MKEQGSKKKKRKRITAEGGKESKGQELFLSYLEKKTPECAKKS